MKSVTITVNGRVQNVGFRYYAQKSALELGIHGFVKNRSDGSVYIEAEGNEADLATFIAWCHRGPAWSRVDEVQIQEQPLQDFKGFHVR
jgi:acylphosphatase